MHAVELLCLREGQLDALACDNAQARFFEFRGDFAGQVAFGGVGFDDRECALNGHDKPHKMVKRQAPRPPRIGSRLRYHGAWGLKSGDCAH